MAEQPDEVIDDKEDEALDDSGQSLCDGNSGFPSQPPRTEPPANEEKSSPSGMIHSVQSYQKFPCTRDFVRPEDYPVVTVIQDMLKLQRNFNGMAGFMHLQSLMGVWSIGSLGSTQIGTNNCVHRHIGKYCIFPTSTSSVVFFNVVEDVGFSDLRKLVARLRERKPLGVACDILLIPVLTKHSELQYAKAKTLVEEIVRPIASAYKFLLGGAAIHHVNKSLGFENIPPSLQDDLVRCAVIMELLGDAKPALTSHDLFREGPTKLDKRVKQYLQQFDKLDQMEDIVLKVGYEVTLRDGTKFLLDVSPAS
jgi:hypothetical protein